MKQIFILLFLIIYSCHQVNPDEELKMRTNQVRARLINGEPLPTSIRNLDAVSFDKQDSLQHDFQYHTTRIENNNVDTVDILLLTAGDSLMHFSFNENHFTNGKPGKTFSYSINKYGVIDFACREELPPGVEYEVTSTPISNGTVLVSSNSRPILEIDFNSHDSILKNPSKKVREMYYSRLKMSVDELYEILFKQ